MSRTIKRILYVILVIIIIGAIAYPKLPGKEENPEANASAAPSRLVVEGTILKPQELQNQVKVTGSILADESVELNTEVAGKVEKIFFKEGQSVSKGQLLLRLNDEEIEAEIEKLQFTKKLNEDSEFRQRQLLDKEAISQEEYETALATLNTVQAEIKVLQARLQKHRIIAPFSGVVGLRNISEGSYLNAGTPVTQLYKINPVKIDFTIPGRYLEKVNVGDEVLFTVDAYEKTSFNGKIYAIEPQIDPQTRSIRLRARSENPEGKLLPGQFTRISLILETIPQALMVPTEAIIPELNSKRIFVYANGKVDSRIVTTGIRTDDAIQVIDGLQEGDTIITTGVLQVKQGLEVDITIN